jgi:hypothetical protein
MGQMDANAKGSQPAPGIIFYLFLFYHLTMDKVKISRSVKCKAPSLELFIIRPISLITSFRRRR